MKNRKEYISSASSIPFYLFLLLVLSGSIAGYLIKNGDSFEKYLSVSILVYLVLIFTLPFILRKVLISSALYALDLTGNLDGYMSQPQLKESFDKDPFNEDKKHLGSPEIGFTLGESKILFRDKELLFLDMSWSAILNSRGHNPFPYADMDINTVPYKDIKYCTVKYVNKAVKISFYLKFILSAFFQKEEMLYHFIIELKDSEMIRTMLNEKLSGFKG